MPAARVQVFEGVVIRRQGHGARETFTVRKQSSASVSSACFPFTRPKIDRIELAARGDVRRAKLDYLRDRVGKRARVRERRYTGPEEAVLPGLLHEPTEASDADGMTAEEAAGEVLSEAPQDDLQESDGGQAEAPADGGEAAGVDEAASAAAGEAGEKAEPEPSPDASDSSTGELDSSSDAGDAGAEAPPGDQPA